MPKAKKPKLSDKEKQKLHAESVFRGNLKNAFDNFDSVYEDTKKELSKKWGFNPAEGDLLWGTTQRLLVDAMKKGDWSSMFSIYFSQALYIHNSGKNSLKYQQILVDLKLKRDAEQGLKRIEILTAGDQSCYSCSKLNKKTFTVIEALKKHPLPNKGCNFKLNPDAPTGWCRCTYLPIVD